MPYIYNGSCIYVYIYICIHAFYASCVLVPNSPNGPTWNFENNIEPPKIQTSKLSPTFSQESLDFWTLLVLFTLPKNARKEQS